MARASRGPALVVLEGARTPFARAFGKLLGIPADELARAAFVEALARAKVDPAGLDEVVLGCAGQPVEAMNVARVAALRAGVPVHVPGFTVHRNCASGIEAIAQALHRVRAGDGSLFLVGGAESMSEAPFQLRREAGRKIAAMGRAKGFLAKVRALRGLRPGDLLPRNTLMSALTDPFSGLIMGDTAEVLAREMTISREAQDAFAAESHRKAIAAQKESRLAAEIAAYFVAPAFKRVIEQDDGPREDSTPERLARLRPVFDRRFGTVTVGNSCQLTDGADALVVSDAATAERRGAAPLGRIVDWVAVGCEPRRMGLGPAIAIPKLLERNGLRISDVDLFEINEAFAVQVLACLQAMGDQAPPRDLLNVNGGAIALGHPVGATGVRITLSLLHELRRRGARRGIASLCVGGGQGAALLVEAEAAA